MVLRPAVCAHFGGVDVNDAGVVRPDAAAAVEAFAGVESCVFGIARDKRCQCAIVYAGVDVVFVAVDVYLRDCGLARCLLLVMVNEDTLVLKARAMAFSMSS